MTSTDGSRLEGPIQRVGVVYRDRTSEIEGILARLETWAGRHDVSVFVEEQGDRALLMEMPGSSTPGCWFAPRMPHSGCGRTQDGSQRSRGWRWSWARCEHGARIWAREVT